MGRKKQPIYAADLKFRQPASAEPDARSQAEIANRKQGGGFEHEHEESPGEVAVARAFQPEICPLRFDCMEIAAQGWGGAVGFMRRREGKCSSTSTRMSTSTSTITARRMNSLSDSGLFVVQGRCPASGGVVFSLAQTLLVCRRKPVLKVMTKKYKILPSPPRAIGVEGEAAMASMP